MKRDILAMSRGKDGVQRQMNMRKFQVEHLLLARTAKCTDTFLKLDYTYCPITSNILPLRDDLNI